MKLTSQCVKQILHLHLLKNNSNLALRVQVDAGGCQGFQYSFELQDLNKKTKTDRLIKKDGATVIVDQMSFKFLEGSEIDYCSDIMGQYFRVLQNPNAKASCGCGTSFDV